MTEQENVQTQEVAEVNPLERSLELQVSYADMESIVSEILRQKAKTARIPGFRKGHVPADKVRAMYGAEAFNEALNQCVGNAWQKAVEEQKLNVAGYPAIDSIPSEDDKVMKFKAVFEVFPEVELPDFSATELKQYVCPVTDKEVEKTLSVMRRQRASFKEVERAAEDGDRVTINFVGKKDGEEFQGGSASGYVFELGQGRMLPEFEAAVKGMKVGEKKTFPLTFPEDYGVEPLNGKEVAFDVELLKVEEAELPELDDEFAKSLGVEGGVEAMRAEIRENLEREVQARLDIMTKRETMEAASAACTFAVPTALVMREAEVLSQQMMNDLAARGINVKKMPPLDPSHFAEEATKRVRLGLFVDALIRKEQIQGSDEQVKEMAEKIAASYENPAEVIDYIMNNPERVSSLRAQATETNVSKWILSKAKTEEETLDFEKLMTGQL